MKEIPSKMPAAASKAMKKGAVAAKAMKVEAKKPAAKSMKREMPKAMKKDSAPAAKKAKTEAAKGKKTAKSVEEDDLDDDEDAMDDEDGDDEDLTAESEAVLAACTDGADGHIYEFIVEKVLNKPVENRSELGVGLLPKVEEKLDAIKVSLEAKIAELQAAEAAFPAKIAALKQQETEQVEKKQGATLNAESAKTEQAEAQQAKDGKQAEID